MSHEVRLASRDDGEGNNDLREEGSQHSGVSTSNPPHTPQKYAQYNDQRHHVFPSPALCNAHQLDAKTLQVYGVLAEERGVVQMESLLARPPLSNVKKMQRMRDARAAQAKYTRDIIKLPHLQIIEAGSPLSKYSRQQQANVLFAEASPRRKQITKLQKQMRLLRVDKKRIMAERNAMRETYKQLQHDIEHRPVVARAALEQMQQRNNTLHAAHLSLSEELQKVENENVELQDRTTDEEQRANALQDDATRNQGVLDDLNDFYVKLAASRAVEADNASDVDQDALLAACNNSDSTVLSALDKCVTKLIKNSLKVFERCSEFRSLARDASTRADTLEKTVDQLSCDLDSIRQEWNSKTEAASVVLLGISKLVVSLESACIDESMPSSEILMGSSASATAAVLEGRLQTLVQVCNIHAAERIEHVNETAQLKQHVEALNQQVLDEQIERRALVQVIEQMKSEIDASATRELQKSQRAKEIEETKAIAKEEPKVAISPNNNARGNTSVEARDADADDSSLGISVGVGALTVSENVSTLQETRTAFGAVDSMVDSESNTGSTNDAQVSATAAVETEKRSDMDEDNADNVNNQGNLDMSTAKEEEKPLSQSHDDKTGDVVTESRSHNISAVRDNGKTVDNTIDLGSTENITTNTTTHTTPTTSSTAAAAVTEEAEAATSAEVLDDGNWVLDPEELDAAVEEENHVVSSSSPDTEVYTQDVGDNNNSSRIDSGKYNAFDDPLEEYFDESLNAEEYMDILPGGDSSGMTGVDGDAGSDVGEGGDTTDEIHPGPWKELKDEESGAPYYENTVQFEVRWERPPTANIINSSNSESGNTEDT